MRRILVAEDNEIMSKLCEALISSVYEDAVFDVASDGREALKLALEEDYCLIVADMEMPVMSGLEFYRSLKEEAPHLLERFIFISELPDPHVRFFCREECIWLEKPFSNREFLCAVDHLLGEERSPFSGVPDPRCSRRICGLKGKRCFD